MASGGETIKKVSPPATDRPQFIPLETPAQGTIASRVFSLRWHLCLSLR